MNNVFTTVEICLMDCFAIFDIVFVLLCCGKSWQFEENDSLLVGHWINNWMDMIYLNTIALQVLLVNIETINRNISFKLCVKNKLINIFIHQTTRYKYNQYLYVVTMTFKVNE